MHPKDTELAKFKVTVSNLLLVGMEINYSDSNLGLYLNTF